MSHELASCNHIRFRSIFQETRFQLFVIERKSRYTLDLSPQAIRGRSSTTHGKRQLPSISHAS